MTSPATMAPPKTKSQALRSYDVADFPALSGMEEEWRFTPLKRLRGLTSATSVSGSLSYAYADLPAGVTVSAVPAAEVEPILGPFARVSALAYQASPEVTLIEVDKGAVLPSAAVIRVVGGGAEAAGARTFVRVGGLAEATLVLEYTGSATLADNVEIDVRDGARLTLVTV